MWKACERIGIKPEDVKDRWEDNNVMTQALLIAYNHVRDCEDADVASAMMGSRLL